MSVVYSWDGLNCSTKCVWNIGRRDHTESDIVTGVALSGSNAGHEVSRPGISSLGE